MNGRIITFFAAAIVILMTVPVQAKDIKYNVKNVPGVVFSHDTHLAKNKDCKTCHSAIFNLAKKRTFTMADMERGQSCGACHNGKKTFGVSTQKDCSKCHYGLTTKTLKYKSKPVSDAVFSHEFHTQAYSCGDCHSKKFDYRQGSRKATMAEMVKGKSCGVCHNGKTAFASSGDCSKCHTGYKPANLTFKNSRGTVVGYFSHDFHTAAYKCEDCHTKTFPYGGGKRITMEEMAKGKSCGACHDGKTAFSVKGDCAKCHKKSK
jgi:c(7)-type cytochrome triheme protein